MCKGLIRKEYQLRGVFNRTAEFPNIIRTSVHQRCWDGMVSSKARQRRSFNSLKWYLGHWLVATGGLSCTTRRQMSDWPFRCQSYLSWWMTGGPIGDNSLWATENARQRNKLKKSIWGYSDPLNSLVRKTEKKGRWEGKKNHRATKTLNCTLRWKKKKKEIIQGKYIQSMKFEYFFW